MTSSHRTVVVTGANGYVAGHVVQELLRSGFHVRGTVRTEKAASQLRTTFPNYIDKQLSIAFITDLTDVESFVHVIDSSVMGVIHTASPAAFPVEDIVEKIIEPAVRSATGVLDAVRRFADAHTFKRVVHLSSLAAMLDHSKGKRAQYVYTETDWCPTTRQSAERMTNYLDAYEASKALSEQAVWKWMEENRPSFDLTCICPSLILGPHVETIHSISGIRSTVRFLWTSLVGATEIPPLEYGGFVDVRDIASIMVSALTTPAASGQRFLVAHHFDWQSAADILRSSVPELRHRIPEGEPGKGRANAERDIYTVDGRKVVEVTQISYRPMADTIKDSMKQLLEIEAMEISSECNQD